MVAIITDKIKQFFAESLYDELVGTKLGDSDNYFYLAVGRSQQWQPATNEDNAPDPANTEREERLFRYSMQSVKAVESFSYVVPLKDWTANTEYSAFNDNVAGQPSTSYYVRTADNNVYLCIRTGKNALGATQVSTVKPSHTSLALPILSDGYIWKYMYTISTADANKFLSTEFMPLKYVDSASSLDPYFGQYTVQNAAIPGQIIGYRVVEKGGIYTSAPAITVVGDGRNARARAILNSTGGIEAVEVDDSDGAGNPTSNGSTPAGYPFGTGYNQANVVVSSSSLSVGGTAAQVVPIFAPAGGLGANAIKDLRSTSIMFNVKPESTVDGTWLVDNDYRQVGLLKNIEDYNSPGTKFTDTSGIAMWRMQLTSSPGDGDPATGYAINFGNSNRIVGGDSDAVAWLDYYNDSNELWYHQDEYTGFTRFRNGEEVTIRNATGTGLSYSGSTLTIADAEIVPDINRYSGDLIFVNNFATVTRDRGQTEDIKLVIKL